MAFLLIKSLRDALSNGLVGSRASWPKLCLRAIGPYEIIKISSKTATPGYHSSLLMLYRSNEKMTAIEYYYNFFW